MATPNERADRALWSDKARHGDLHIGTDVDRNRRRRVDPEIPRSIQCAGSVAFELQAAAV